MSGNILSMMIGISTFLGALGLFALIWGIKTGQFDDKHKFLEATKFDDEDALNDAVMMEKRKEQKRIREKNYSPPD
ncbi:MAG: cbb3-type cytochrome oxidase assembly protein CcoS [Sulfurospirillum sp.]|nr:MAG: cbb3-type cytochrome oxidase assembly protein CcoS [Sulfurospirillum sp.]